ncbi:MAG: ATP-dependent DNA ligase [Planctomycetes bacterium]|nr:ATP-dependent DNA ligase [Planctomycetota bacterium]
MNLTDYIAKHRSTARKPTADIRSRWASRIVARNLHQQAAAGAQAYLRDYGKGISTAKVIALAIQAEVEGCDDMARGFWAKAFELETGISAPATASSDVTSRSNKEAASAPLAVAFPGLPAHLQPGRIITMQPVDAAGTHDDYIHNPIYCGQPKRDGSRIVVIASSQPVVYQSRSTSILASPSMSFDGAFRRAAEAKGPFVLDGELVYLDASGGEHRTGSQAAQANATNDHPDARVRCRICVFRALFANGRDLTSADEEARIRGAEIIVGIAQGILIKAGVEDYDIEQVPTAWTKAQKHALVCRQQDEGREGEVWIQRQTRYLGGKHGEIMVRTKYLAETEVVITALTPTTVAGRPFGAMEVAEAKPDGAGRPLGRVGTGFSAEDASEIAMLVARHPEGLRILVRHQGRTETGMLWHARFLRIIGPVGMVA